MLLSGHIAYRSLGVDVMLQRTNAYRSLPCDMGCQRCLRAESKPLDGHGAGTKEHTRSRPPNDCLEQAVHCARTAHGHQNPPLSDAMPYRHPLARHIATGPLRS